MTPSPSRWTPLLRAAAYALLGVVVGSILTAHATPTTTAVIIAAVTLAVAGWSWWDHRRFMARMRAEAAEWHRRIAEDLERGNVEWRQVPAEDPEHRP